MRKLGISVGPLSAVSPLFGLQLSFYPTFEKRWTLINASSERLVLFYWFHHSFISHVTLICSRFMVVSWASVMRFNPSSWVSALPLNGMFNYFAASSSPSQVALSPVGPAPYNYASASIQRDAFLETLVYNMTVPELGSSRFSHERLLPQIYIY
jgi:hypothetical protein